MFLVHLSAQVLLAQGLVSHTIQISSDGDDGYYNENDGSGWHSTPQAGGADWVGSWGGVTAAWVAGYRFPSTGINSGDTIRSAYIELVSSDGFATNSACGSAPCPGSISTFRVYGVAQDNGAAFSNTAGNTPVSVPYTTAYVDYTTTGPGDAHGSCQGENNGQNTCTHIIDVTNIVKEITSRPGWTNTSAMRFVMLSTNSAGPNVYAGYEDYSANPAKAATLLVNPPEPTIVSSGAWGTSATATYPTSYATGPFVYPGASTILLFLGDYYDFYNQTVSQPTVTDSCGNTWNILAGPTDWAGYYYDMRSTVYYVQNPASCPAGDTITVTPGTTTNGEPIFLHFLAIAGSNPAQTPVASAITSPPPATYTTSASTNFITLNGTGLLVSWIFGDSDSPHTFTPQAGFATDVNSTANYLTAATESVSAAGSYQNQFVISPSDGWQTILIGMQAATGTAAAPTMSVTPSSSNIGTTQDLTVTVTVSGTPTPTGSVTLTGGGYTSSATTLSSGVATIDVPAGSLSTGTDELTATYTPDSSSSSIYTSATGTTSVTVTNAAPAAITSPMPGSTLTSASTTFNWNTGSGGVTGYYLWIGTTPGGYDLANMGPFSGTSATVNLPTSGATIYVRLWTFLNGGATQLHNDYTYTESTVATAAITSPAPNSTLTSASTTFNWSAGSGGVTGYYLWVGTSPGTANLINMGPLSGTSATVNLPTSGATIYVRLWTVLNGSTFLYNDYTFTESTVAAAAINSPSPGSILTGASTTFTWNAATGATGYYLWIGTTPGGYDLANLGPFSGTSATVTLPTSGAPIYVRLWTVLNGSTFVYNDYTFTESAVAAGVIISPTPSSTLTGAATTFSWNAGSGGVTGYYLWVGTSPGTANLINIGPLSGTSATVNLPTSGATIYVRLWTFLNGGATQLYNDYTFTESVVSAGVIISPTPSSTLTGASTTFTWNAGSGGVTGYYLWVGTSPGTANLIDLGPLSATSTTVNLPTNGAPIYVRLWTFINGGATQLYNDYSYTEAP
ncbi:MAG: Ig-like domain-containing protein [Terracidiphilus sp.]